MNRSEKRATERFHDVQRQSGFEDLLACPLLHFIRSAIRVGNDHELRQPFERMLWTSRDFDNPIGDRARFSGARRSDERKVAVQFASKSLSRCFVGNRRHVTSSSSSSTNGGWVSAHFALSRSVSIGRVASGYFLTNPNSLCTGPIIPNMPVSCIRCSSLQKSFCASTSAK